MSKQEKHQNPSVLLSLDETAGERRRRRRSRTLSGYSDENNEGGRLLWWGAVKLNMQKRMEHNHLQR